MNVTPPNPSWLPRLFAAAAKWTLWLLLAAWLLLALAWGALHGWIVPRIADLRPVLELRASQVLGVPLKIGSITARTEGLVPSFELQDVVLLDAQGRNAVRLPLVVAAFSPRSLWNLGFEQLYIDQPELDIRRDRAGRFFVAGIDFSRTSGNEGRAADWFFSQTEFVIRGGTLRWTDELRDAPPLALTDVNFVMRNGARRHALRLDASPPAGWGQRFSLAGVFRQPLLSASAGNWQNWMGQVHGDFASVDLSQLRRHVDFGVQVASGQGRLRAWADVARGQVVGGVADVVLSGVNATLGTGLPPLVVESMSGRLGGKRLAGGFQVETKDLQFITEEGDRWPGGNFAITWTAADGRQPAQGDLRGDRLDLGALSLIATRLPLGTATHAALAAYAPEGLVERFQARWQGPLSSPRNYEAHGRASGLQVAARPSPDGRAGSPGVRGATVDFELTQAGGKARVALQRGALAFPGVFEEPALKLDTLSGDVQWQREGEQLAVSVSGLKFANADAQGEARASWRTGDPAAPDGSRFPGVIDLEATMGRADGARVWRYLPLGVPKPARDYVRASVLAGAASGAKFRLKGDLRDFPFTDPRKGQFLITTQVRDVTFAYVPRSSEQGPGAWPVLTQLSAELVFERNGMAIRNARGRFVGAPRLQVQADAAIPDYEQTRVGVTGRIGGPLADSLSIVNNSPLAALMNQALAQASGNGHAEVDLALAIPVHEIDRSQVQGTVTLAGNDVQVTPGSPLLARARGLVQFNEKGFHVPGVQARAFGGDVRLEGGSRPAAPGEPVPIHLRAQGTVTAEGLRAARELGFVSRLARDFSGSTSYSLALAVRRGTPEVHIASNLQGLAINLPAPLNKPAEAQLPLRYETALTRESLAPDAPALRETLAVELGRLASIQYLRDVTGAEPQVLRGAIGIGLAPGELVTMPETGVAANVQLADFSVDAWEDALARASGAASASAPDAPIRGAAGGSALDYLPTVIGLRAGRLSLEGHTLHNVVLGGSRAHQTWRANVDADELNGYLEFRQPQGAGAGRLHARLARLRIAAAAAGDVEQMLEQQTVSIPALDVIVDDFELKGRKVGRLEIEAVNRGAGAVARDGGVREWRLNRLALVMPEATFSASGNWAALAAQPLPAGSPRALPAAPGERRRTVMKFRLDIADAGLLLGRFGMEDIVRRGRGSMEGTVAWIGSPLSFDYPSMTGSFNVNVESGQFMKADPGLAKLLGVLSLQSLPRRLALDFRDVFSEGFPFDFVRGDVTIEEGLAATNNLQMKGVNAAVLMEGKADIGRETQDLKVVVVPEINAGTASLVATVINPAIGLGSFLAQLFLRQPLMRAATQEFHIDGTWSDPRITRVARTPSAPGSSASGAAPEPQPAR